LIGGNAGGFTLAFGAGGFELGVGGLNGMYGVGIIAGDAARGGWLGGTGADGRRIVRSSSSIARGLTSPLSDGAGNGLSDGGGALDVGFGGAIVARSFVGIISV
jgi:hypothetical protein